LCDNNGCISDNYWYWPCVWKLWQLVKQLPYQNKLVGLRDKEVMFRPSNQTVDVVKKLKFEYEN
jgi:hypothetical protein